MDPAHFLTSPRVTIVAGKGGVGKTTVSLALGLAATRLGLTALLIEIEEGSAVGTLFGVKHLAHEPVVLRAADPSIGQGELTARELMADNSLVEYLHDHGLKRISSRLASSGALDMVATATPGIKDVLILGKVKQLERSAKADVIIVDAPAAGHAITFLSSAVGLLDAVQVGPIETQAREVMELLADPDRCQVLLVTLPEETPVNEVIDTAFKLEDRVGVRLAPIVVNGCYPDSDGLDVDPEVAAAEAGVTLRKGEAEALGLAAAFVGERSRLQAAQLGRLDHDLPLPQLRLPFCFTSELDLDDLDTLADALIEEIRLLPEDVA